MCPIEYVGCDLAILRHKNSRAAIYKKWQLFLFDFVVFNKQLDLIGN